MGIFGRFFPRTRVQATSAALGASPERKDDQLSPYPAKSYEWKRVSLAEWLKPDSISQAQSRIAQNPQYYVWCRDLVDALFKKHPRLVTQPVAREYSKTGAWASSFGPSVARWMLLLPQGTTDQRHYCNGLAVCLTLPGFDTDERLHDFLDRCESSESSCKSDGDSPFLSISDFDLIDRNDHFKRDCLWISAIPVLRATKDRTFLRGEPFRRPYESDRHNLRAFNPRLLPPTPGHLWSDGHISWLGTSSFLAFLDAWAAATPISAADVPYGESISATDKAALAAGGFAELCKACGTTYFDVSNAACTRCGCHADDPDDLLQYASSKKHATWVMGELKEQVTRELQKVAEDRRRAEEDVRRKEEERCRAEEAFRLKEEGRLEQQRWLTEQRRQVEKRTQERLRIERDKQDVLAKMASATESISTLRRQLVEADANGGNSSAHMRETCLRKLHEAIARYENASALFEKLDQSDSKTQGPA